jgi:hypothetical protein
MVKVVHLLKGDYVLCQWVYKHRVKYTENIAEVTCQRCKRKMDTVNKNSTPLSFAKLSRQTMEQAQQKRITWKVQDKYYGLDYSYLSGVVHDHAFDIRYDYDGPPEVKPNDKCGLWLYISYQGKQMKSVSGDTVQDLTSYAERYLDREIKEFIKNYILA